MSARIAVIGAGRMGRVHLRALRAAERARPVAVVDPVDEARAAAAGDGLAAHASVDALLDTGGFDAVLIAAPTDLHRGLVERLAAAGVAMLCEKPCGLTADDARAATEAAERAGVPLQIGYWRRFVPELRDLRARLGRGELGEPQLVACHQWDEAPPPAGFRERSGGIAIDMAVHEIDQLRWLLGQEVGELAAAAGGPAAPPGDADVAVAVGRLSGGAVGTITLGRRFPDGDSCWAELWGTGGYARVPFMWGAGGERVFTAALAAQADAFAAALAGDPVRGATGADAVAALAAAERLRRALGG
jgi:myo-inositol 2-dehydrogenase / D-chiro-inositol 1-dehydrogenase